MEKLIFGKGNKKLAKNIGTFSLPAGFTCPMAFECQAWANRETGKITDGKYQLFRCFAASAEAVYPNVRKARWHNFEALRQSSDMASLILASLPNTPIVRIHVSGDYFSQDYFDAWLKVAQTRSDIIFYSYTKSIHYWQNRTNEIPDNFRLTASMGGKLDEIAQDLDLVTAQVVRSNDEAEKLALSIDTDDNLAISNKGKFALLIHGIQPKIFH